MYKHTHALYIFYQFFLFVVYPFLFCDAHRFIYVHRYKPCNFLPANKKGNEKEKKNSEAKNENGKIHQKPFTIFTKHLQANHCVVHCVNFHHITIYFNIVFWISFSLLIVHCYIQNLICAA